jgi:hypothetical protein
LLSSQYPGTVTPRSSIRKAVVLDDKALGLQQLELPFLGGISGGGGGGGSMLTTIDVPLSLHTSFQRRPSLVQGEYKTNGGDADGDDWLLLDSDERNLQDDQEEYIAPPLAVSSGLLTSSSALSLQALLQQATATAPPPLDISSSGSKNGDATPPTMERLFAAPKYATAVFRLIYTVVCVTIAMYYFSDADFWPPAVGGRGDTKKCWDLSSVGAAVMDSDFDQHNSVLRRYFLVQASYHIHSGAFHIVASLLLWFVSSSRNRKSGKAQPAPKKILGFLPPGMLTVINIQQFFQHCFAVVLIAGTYLFSSMRRLAAVGMFAFDVSSLFLHLLQLCINAPPNLRRSSPTWVWILYRALVIPSFCYSRFYVFPFVLGYSAIFESQDWLRQLENMSVPGLAKVMQFIFIVWLCLLMVMNIIYIKRLLYHPHVLRALNKQP